MFKYLKRMLHTLMWGTEGKPGQPEPQPVAPIKPDPNPWDGKSFFQWNQEVIREARAKGLSFHNGTAYGFIDKELKKHPEYEKVFADKYKHSTTPPSPHIPKSKLDDILWIEKMKAYEQFIPEDVRAIALARRVESMWANTIERLEQEQLQKGRRTIEVDAREYETYLRAKKDKPPLATAGALVGSLYFCHQCGRDVTHLADLENNIVHKFCSTDCSDKYHGWTT